MFVVRPLGIRTTPRNLAHDLSCQTRFFPNTRHPSSFDYGRDFFLTPVAPSLVSNAPTEYGVAYHFYTRNKYGQRQLLQDGGIPVPRAWNRRLDAGEHGDGAKFVVRPLRHSRGLGYRVTQNGTDFNEGSEYCSVLYPKKREYRIIFVFGKPLIVLRKKPNEGVSEEAPWGHVNSSFQTINDVGSCRLSGTDVFSRLGALPIVVGSHIVAADILYNKSVEPSYVVLELNTCPALDIEGNRAKVVEAIKERIVV